MGSRLHGVPISTTQMVPKAAPPYNKASSGIRAPLTVDESDFEFSASSKSHRNSTASSYYSGSELESEGFESGEDEFETASERPYVTDQDDAILEETHYIKKYTFSRPVSENPNGERVERSSYSYEDGFFRPSVKNPDGEIVEISGNITGNVLPRPFVRNPDELNYKGFSKVNGNNVSRPFLSDSDEEVFEDDNYEDGGCVLKNGDSIPVVAVVDEEVSESESSSVVDIGSSLMPRSHMPIAKISRDSDDESQGSEVLEDYSFSTVARVPSIEVLQRLNSAPKVRVLKVEEGEDSGSLAANMAENEVIDSVVSNGFLGSRNEEESIGVQGTIRTVLSADMFHNKGPDSNGLVRANSLILNEEQNSVSESECNRDLIFLNDEIQEADVMLDKRKCVHLVNHGRPTDFTEDILLPGCCSCVVTAAEPRCLCETVKLMEFEVSELKSIGDLVPLSMDNLVFDLSIESNEVERKSEQKIDKTVETCKGETLDQGVQNEEEPNGGCPQLSESPEAVINSRHGDMYYSLLKNDCSIGISNTCPSVLPDTKLDQEAKYIAENSELLPGEAENLIFQADAEAAMVAEIEEQAFTSLSCGEILQDNAQEIDAQLVMDLEEEANADDEIGDRRQTIDSAALDAFLKADRGAVSDSNTVKFTSVDSTDEFSLKTSSTDLNSIFHSTKPITETRNADQFAPPRTNGEFEEAFSEGQKQQLEKIQQIRVKYLQLLHRLGMSPEDSVAANVLYQLAITEERFISQASRLDSDKKAAIELEVLTKNDLNFTLSILVIGKTGVGKSATINSIFGERKTKIDAFEPSTTEAKEIVGMVAEVKVKVFDTPGLRTRIDQSHNRKVLFSIKKLIQRSPPDIVLYIDRLDTQINNLDDLPVLKLVSTYLGPSIWRKAIIILTHATSIPPDGPNGYPLTYEVFVAWRSRVVQQLISHSAGELLLMNPGLSFPVALAENHPFAEKNELGEKLLHNGESWRSQLLLLCYSMKIFSELNSVVDVQNPLNHTKLFGFKICSPWLPYFLSSSMESTVHPKLSNDLGGENVDSTTERGYSTDSDLEDGESDKLPPFKPFKKSEIAKLSKGQRKAYFEEYDYRGELLEKKQWREDVRRLRYMKKIESCGSNDTYVDQETGSTETVAVPLPYMALPPSFDGENPSFRYRALESPSNLLVRPVLNSHGWDHDFGYDGVVIEDKFAIASQFPAGISVQITKDKKECNIQLRSSVSAKHKDKGSTMTGLGIQSIGKQAPYILKGDSKIMNFKMNRTAAGISITFLGDKIISGLEVVDQITVGKWLTFTGNAGVIRSHNDAAHGENLEVDLKKKNYTTPQGQSSAGLSTMKWRGNLIWGCNLQSEFSFGRNYKLHIQAGLNNKPSGQISVRTSSSDQLQIAVIALLPIAKTIFRNVFPQANENYSI